MHWATQEVEVGVGVRVSVEVGAGVEVSESLLVVAVVVFIWVAPVRWAALVLAVLVGPAQYGHRRTASDLCLRTAA